MTTLPEHPPFALRARLLRPSPQIEDKGGNAHHPFIESFGIGTDDRLMFHAGPAQAEMQVDVALPRGRVLRVMVVVRAGIVARPVAQHLQAPA